ncbi:Cu(I)-responsive transcriptional regulator [Rhizobium sp. SEMIA 4085]|uniref:Cu(I)-responsive transcriptional regulator protein HmrR 1 n=1 Tax=Rhizobium gallicum bv. gallicum R602sp TaxID=1041138 RepID=A0A0B4X564_9HYPH|nr:MULTISPECIES: Cu(I)-responsive transcriptional regulator [Rhizobium]AJD41647.1 Cu(I)-responsive transcriptional regulator protein HmrR 1 [Rhizobium gallicum bv. gallicum R602sp]NNH28826.1 Cu(I)-responsive transcriptional regulator [Rhizobium sp. SEMIA 4085]
MNIGQAAKASGVSAKMIRYYEQIKLITPAHRTESSYRTYCENDIHTLRFIRRARDLGFSVEQMKTLLALWRDRSRASADVKSIALEHIAELERKAAAIQAMTQTLKHLANHCHGDERPDCPIIEEFANSASDDDLPGINARFGVNGLRTELPSR